MYELIGGKVYDLYKSNPLSYQNACALRLSRALNYSGFPISSGNGYYMAKGEDKLNYLFRVREMIKYINNKFSSPDVTINIQNGKIIRKDKGASKRVTHLTMDEAVKGLKGIIVFHVIGWGDATGHITLFSYQKAIGDLKSKCEDDSCYFEHDRANINTYKIKLWSLS